MQLKALVLEDEPTLRVPLCDQIAELGHEVIEAEDGVQGLELALHELPDIVLCDVRLPRLNGLEVFRRAHKAQPQVRFVLMTAYGSVADAVDALKEGAYDYLTKPFEMARVANLFRRVSEEASLRDELHRARDAIREADAYRKALVGNSPAMRHIVDRVRLAAGADIPILLTGESGTGKSVLAQLVHKLSGRRKGPVVELNCATIPENLFESELFGHERGAFTGAVRKHLGKVARANGGTLFLDEIGEMPLVTQPKLLRFLDRGRYEPVGVDGEERSDIRLVAATNQDLFKKVEEGRFREDLYYRVNAMEVPLPALRERPDDIPLLIQHFIDQSVREGLPAPTSFSPMAWDLLLHHSYPGNVRELRNVVQHVMVVAQGDLVQTEHLPGRLRPEAGETPAPSEEQVGSALELSAAIARFETQHIRRVLTATSGNRTEAARVLGISRKNLWEKMKRLNIEGI